MKRRRFVQAAAVVGVGAFVGWYWPRRWRYIVVHHSAGNFGTIEFLQEVHRERQRGDPLDAIPYHYVIGNGNGLGMGEVASDWRSDLHLWGTHVSENSPAHNLFGIGICLIGNFEEHDVPDEQFDALVVLTRNLMDRYGIDVNEVTGHGLIDDESTACPGSRFPMEKLKRAIA